MSISLLATGQARLGRLACALSVVWQAMASLSIWILLLGLWGTVSTISTFLLHTTVTTCNRKHCSLSVSFHSLFISLSSLLSSATLPTPLPLFLHFPPSSSVPSQSHPITITLLCFIFIGCNACNWRNPFLIMYRVHRFMLIIFAFRMKTNYIPG